MSATAPSKRRRIKNAYRDGDYGPMHLRKGRGGAIATTKAATALSAPTGVTATAGTGSITLAWTPMANVLKFAIDRSPDGSTGWAAYATVIGYGTGIRFTGLTAGVAQYFRVAAVNGNGITSAASTVVTTTPL